ncbi:MAG: toll/interleukin-1 receptor domain-containing protein, partial [Clostridiaceae bacterium]|nr:toll/interleukin-1 receptor domain-containing protein [Clostridiaceae bacterium]
MIGIIMWIVGESVQAGLATWMDLADNGVDLAGGLFKAIEKLINEKKLSKKLVAHYEKLINDCGYASEVRAFFEAAKEEGFAGAKGHFKNKDFAKQLQKLLLSILAFTVKNKTRENCEKSAAFNEIENEEVKVAIVGIIDDFREKLVSLRFKILPNDSQTVVAAVISALRMEFQNAGSTQAIINDRAMVDTFAAFLAQNREAIFSKIVEKKDVQWIIHSCPNCHSTDVDITLNANRFRCNACGAKVTRAQVEITLEDYRKLAVASEGNIVGAIEKKLTTEVARLEKSGKTLTEEAKADIRKEITAAAEKAAYDNGLVQLDIFVLSGKLENGLKNLDDKIGKGIVTVVANSDANAERILNEVKDVKRLLTDDSKADKKAPAAKAEEYKEAAIKELKDLIKFPRKGLDTEAVKAAAKEVLRYKPLNIFARLYTILFGNKSTFQEDLLKLLKSDFTKEDVEDDILFIKCLLEEDYNIDFHAPIIAFVERYIMPKRSGQKSLITDLEKLAVEYDSGMYDAYKQRDVFIAYSSKDQEEAEGLVTYLTSQGISCFISCRNMKHGTGSDALYWDTIKTALDRCKIFLFINSKNSRNVACNAYSKELSFVLEADQDAYAAAVPTVYRRKRSLSAKEIPDAYRKDRINYIYQAYENKGIDQDVKNFFDGYSDVHTHKEIEKRILEINRLVGLPQDAPISPKSESPVLAEPAKPILPNKEKKPIEPVTPIYESEPEKVLREYLEKKAKEAAEAQKRDEAEELYKSIVSSYNSLKVHIKNIGADNCPESLPCYGVAEVLKKGISDLQTRVTGAKALVGRLEIGGLKEEAAEIAVACGNLKKTAGYIATEIAAETEKKRLAEEAERKRREAWLAEIRERVKSGYIHMGSFPQDAWSALSNKGSYTPIKWRILNKDTWEKDGELFLLSELI